MNNKYICIHGHFYQPPRENAWLEEVELQDSAAPFHDWNSRINFECYAPNTAARILDSQRNIKKIINNYTKINFNFGPTLLSWMEKADPDTYKNILKADKISLKQFSGHGSAIAQVYSHLIMPLANREDKITQVIWGIRDFESRFDRKPEGMWLAETAVDTPTLEVLADYGIKYTIFAPRQAKALRKIGASDWQYIHNEALDTRMPFQIQLPSGKTIAAFVYDGKVAQDVAFNGLLNNGKAFANRLANNFDDNDYPQLVNIATDGESYGHHHRFGEMALADCLNHIESKDDVQLTNYGEYLEKFPPTYELMIHENSSWSCVHGVERWRANCGCNSGGHGNWNQEWRYHLREILNWLRDEMIPIFEREAGKLVHHIWDARNDYISIILDRSNDNVDDFIKRNAKNNLSKKQQTQLLRLMEMQRNSILMFTSCGWFFDEISGLETNQILQYALRAIAYAKQTSGVDFHPEFLDRLRNAPSNVYENGATSYEQHVMPAQLGLTRVGMHYAVSSLFEEYPQQLEFFNYIANSELYERLQEGNMKIAVGRTTVKSKITHSEKQFSFAVIYLGQQNIFGNISIDMDRATFDEMRQRLFKAFRSTNLGDVITIVQRYFGDKTFTIWHLFLDEKRKILRQISKSSIMKSDAAFRDIYTDNYQLMTGMQASHIPVPSAFKHAAQYVINTDLHRFFTQDKLKVKVLGKLADEIQKWNIEIGNEASLKLAASERIFYEIQKIASASSSVEHLQILNDIFETLSRLNIELDIWKSQNLYFSITKGFKNGNWEFSSDTWQDEFIKLGNHLKIQLEKRNPVLV